jgi:hypothetical protein
MVEHPLNHKLKSGFYSVLTFTFFGGLVFSDLARLGSDYPIGWVYGWLIGAVDSTAAIAICILYASRLKVGGWKEYYLHAVVGLAVGAAMFLAFALPTVGAAWLVSALPWKQALIVTLLGSFAACDYHILLTKDDKKPA